MDKQNILSVEETNPEDCSSKLVINPLLIAAHICEVEKDITSTRTSLDEVITKTNVDMNRDELYQMLSIIRDNLMEAERNIERLKEASENTRDQMQMLENKLTQQTEVEKQHLQKISALSEELEKYKVQHSDFRKESDAKMEELSVETAKQEKEIGNLQVQSQCLQTRQNEIAVVQERQKQHLASHDKSIENIKHTLSSQHDKIIEVVGDLQAKVSNHEKKLREMEDNTDPIISKDQMQERRNRRVSAPPGYSLEVARQYAPIKTMDRPRMDSGISMTSVTSESDMIPPGNESGFASMVTSRESSSSQIQMNVTMDSHDTTNLQTLLAGNDHLHLPNVDQQQMDDTTPRNTPPSTPRASCK